MRSTKNLRSTNLRDLTPKDIELFDGLSWYEKLNARLEDLSDIFIVQTPPFPSYKETFYRDTLPIALRDRVEYEKQFARQRFEEFKKIYPSYNISCEKFVRIFRYFLKKGVLDVDEDFMGDVDVR